MASEGREIEIKLRVRDIAELRAKLRRLRAVAAARLFERNTLYDTTGAELRSSGRLLRIRIESPAPVPKAAAARGPRSARGLQVAARGVLTYKAPIVGMAESSEARRYKERQELEIEFHPAEGLESILRALGFRAGFRYEKYRTEYRLAKLKDLHLDLDETPIGDYLELEGSPAAIDRAAKLLGFKAADYITATYWDLYVADCRGRGITPSDLVFHRRKK
ncbi:MAG: class IV adenylate cyclase [Candidatus Acidiferrales bacterium]